MKLFKSVFHILFQEFEDYGLEPDGIVKEGVMAAAREAYKSGIGNQAFHCLGVGEWGGGVVLAPYEQDRGLD